MGGLKPVNRLVNKTCIPDISCTSVIPILSFTLVLLHHSPFMTSAFFLLFSVLFLSNLSKHDSSEIM